MFRPVRFTLRQVLLATSLLAMLLAAIVEVHGRFKYHYFDSSVACSPDGRMIATGISSMPATLWAETTFRPIMALHGHSQYVSGVDFSPDGKLLATAGTDDTVRIWDVASGREIRQFVAKQHGVMCVRFSPDGLIVATGGRYSMVRLWQVSSGKELAALQGHLPDVVKKLAFSPDGQWLATVGQNKKAILWEMRSSAQAPSGFSPRAVAALKPPTGSIEDVAFSRDGFLLTSSSGANRSQIWDVHSGVLIGEIPIAEHESLTAIAVSQDGKKLAMGHFGKVTLWDLVQDHRVATFDGHGNWVCSLAFSPDGRKLVSGASNNSVMVWDLVHEKRVAVLHPDTHRPPWDVLFYFLAGLVAWFGLAIQGTRRFSQRRRVCRTEITESPIRGLQRE